MKYDFGFIAIGDEITDGDIINTNTRAFAKYLVNKQFNVGFHIICKDIMEDISNSINFLKSNHSNIITIGGLGPTEDDLTTEGVAQFFKKNLTLDENSWKLLEKRMIEKYGKITLDTRKQALFPQGSKIIVNKNGTANGFSLEFQNNRYIYVFPGPPKECIPMLESLNLENVTYKKKIIRKTWKVYKVGESFLAEKLLKIKSIYPFVSFKYRITENGFVELKYFYPEGCQYSDAIITNVERLLKEYLQPNT